MPQFTFSPVQIDALVNALLSHNERALTMPRGENSARASAFALRARGKAGQLIADLNCLELPRHQWPRRRHGARPHMGRQLRAAPVAVQFFRNPNTLRPALIRRMPKFNLTDAEIETLSDYILTVYQSPKIDRDSMPLTGYPPAQVERAGSFITRNTAASHATSSIQNRTRATSAQRSRTFGSRLTAAWIYNWMKDPSSFGPAHRNRNATCLTTMPRALTAFLMSQKRSRTTGGEEAMNGILHKFFFSPSPVSGCSRQPNRAYCCPSPTAYGAALVEVKRRKATAEVGTPLPQPVVVQVNDDQGKRSRRARRASRSNGTYLDRHWPDRLQRPIHVQHFARHGSRRYQLMASTQTKPVSRRAEARGDRPRLPRNVGQPTERSILRPLS